jgi:hypothetical protein
VLDDLRRDQFWSRKAAAVLQKLAAEPEDVQGCLVPSDQVLVGEDPEALCLRALLPISGW